MFIPVSEFEFIIKFYDKLTPCIEKELDPKARLGDFINMKLADRQNEVIFYGKNYEQFLFLFSSLNCDKYPDQIAFKKGFLKLSFNSSATMIHICQLFFSFLLSCYQVYKLFIITDFRTKKVENGSNEHKTSRSIFQIENNVLVGIGAENKYYKFTIELKEPNFIYFPKISC